MKKISTLFLALVFAFVALGSVATMAEAKAMKKTTKKMMKKKAAPAPKMKY